MPARLQRLLRSISYAATSRIPYRVGMTDNRRPSQLFTVALLAGSVIIFGTAGALSARVVPDSLSVAGIPLFVLSDLGGVSRATLERAALPYKVVATGLIMREERIRNTRLERKDLRGIYRKFGFLFPDSIGNWPSSLPQPHFERPLGMVGHVVKGPTPLVRIDAVNIGCATCHTGAVYDANGFATNVAWAGSPNTSINLEAYTQAVYAGLKIAVADQSAFRSRTARLFPEMSLREKLTLRFFLLPKISGRLRQLADSGDKPLPYSNGGAGRTNGAASLKRMMGVPPGTISGHADIGYTSIPELAGRGLRSSLLYDGVYAAAGVSRFETLDTTALTPSRMENLAAIVSFFLVPTMGATTDVSEAAIPTVRQIVEWIAKDHLPPPFPGRIDSALMADGQRIFGAQCAKCHGTYSDARPRRLVSFPNKIVPQQAMGSDSARWDVIDQAVLEKLANDPYIKHLSVQNTGGYVAPILLGVWNTAPYLHNGSVPTLWQLMNPAERPERFFTGGHKLDYNTVGIAGQLDSSGVYRYPQGYMPWSEPELYDTRQPGFSNKGHERQFRDLTQDQKRALLEYLKTL